LSRKPRLLDLFCGAGGAAVGYHRAGFEVVGVDLSPQKRYPFEFHQGDAMSFPLDGFDAVHASPPCQWYSVSAHLPWVDVGDEYPLIGLVRERLVGAGVPYVIENVEGARAFMNDPVMLCGSAFGLPMWRHRLFEMPGVLVLSPGCSHREMPVQQLYARKDRPGRVYKRRALPVYGGARGGTSFNGRRPTIAEARVAMGIDWMTWTEISEAVPPAYTQFIGERLMAAFKRENAVA
jgi:DNA (cytosine-5)-methyltransferase 1